MDLQLRHLVIATQRQPATTAVMDHTVRRFSRAVSCARLERGKECVAIAIAIVITQRMQRSMPPIGKMLTPAAPVSKQQRCWTNTRNWQTGTVGIFLGIISKLPDCGNTLRRHICTVQTPPSWLSAHATAQFRSSPSAEPRSCQEKLHHASANIKHIETVALDRGVKVTQSLPVWRAKLNRDT